MDAGRRGEQSGVTQAGLIELIPRRRSACARAHRYDAAAPAARRAARALRPRHRGIPRHPPR